jgi:hypothetical protein
VFATTRERAIYTTSATKNVSKKARIKLVSYSSSSATNVLINKTGGDQFQDCSKLVNKIVIKIA